MIDMLFILILIITTYACIGINIIIQEDYKSSLLGLIMRIISTLGLILMTTITLSGIVLFFLLINQNHLNLIS